MKDFGKKKLLMTTVGIIGIVIVISIILLIYNAIFGKTSYKDIENELVIAARKYYRVNSSLLPNNETEEVTISDVSLTAAGYLKSMSEFTKKMKGVTCTANVIVNYADGEYRYTPLLDCGNSYSTNTLSSYIMKKEKIVYTGQGLYDLNGQLVYRGENPDNYVRFSNKLWRIVKIENEQVIMILEERAERSVWDDRFNTERNRTDGINDYTVSRINEKLIEIYQSDTLFNSNTKKLLVSHPLHIGKRYETDMYNDGSIEKSIYAEAQYIGLLPLYDYINASIDTNCLSANTASCKNYNYLNHYDYNWWTLTADASNTYKVYRISDQGDIEIMKASSNGYIRPVIHLAKDVLYDKGTGTESDPYTIK